MRILPLPLRAAALAAASLLALEGCGSDQPTGPEDRPAAAVAATAALSFFQLSGGYGRTCGVTNDNLAYCWGDNAQGWLGDGTTTDRLSPTAVVGNLRFRQISTGVNATCGVTTDFRAYCWGFGGTGALGYGGTDERDSPVAVAGGHQFSQVDAGGFDHACALSYPDNRVFCWGLNTDGQLGIGNRTGPDACPFGGACSVKPLPIASTLTFRQVAVGWRHSCAVTTDDKLFCWGLNSSGQVGDSSTVFRRATPTRVGRSLHWKQVDGGNEFTCAVTTTNQAYCWGNGKLGQLGNGHTYLSYWPRSVSGNHSFRRVTAGGTHACGETPQSVVWCWGDYAPNFGVGSAVPVAVSGGLLFAQVSAGVNHTCGRTPGGVGYCWGSNGNGEFGTGHTDPHRVTSPVPIGPPS